MVAASCIARGVRQQKASRDRRWSSGLEWHRRRHCSRWPLYLAKIGIRVYSTGVRGQHGDLTAASQRTKGHSDDGRVWERDFIGIYRMGPTASPEEAALPLRSEHGLTHRNFGLEKRRLSRRRQALSESFCIPQLLR